MSEGPTQFTVEQPARLNPLVDETIPLTWQVRWRTIKLCLPLLVLSSVCFVEITFIRLWLADEMAERWPRLILACLVFPLFVIGVLEVEARIRHLRKRRLTLKPRGLQFGSGDSFCPWRAFAGFRFYPIASESNLKRCVVLRKDRQKHVGEWPRVSLALDGTQQQALIRAVAAFRPAGLGEIQVEEQQYPAMVIHPGSLFFKGAAVSTIGLYLLLHGAPLLAAFFPGREPDRSNRTSEFVISERRADQMADFVAHHFRNKKEFLACGFWVGTTLTFLGITGMTAGGFLFGRDRRHRFNRRSC